MSSTKPSDLLESPSIVKTAAQPLLCMVSQPGHGAGCGAALRSAPTVSPARARQISQPEAQVHRTLSSRAQVVETLSTHSRHWDSVYGAFKQYKLHTLKPILFAEIFTLILGKPIFLIAPAPEKNKTKLSQRESDREESMHAAFKLSNGTICNPLSPFC